MARKRASMREGPLAELFRRTEAAQRAQEAEATEEETVESVRDRRELAALEETVEHVHDFAEAPAAQAYRDLAKEVLDGAQAREHA